MQRRGYMRRSRIWHAVWWQSQRATWQQPLQVMHIILCDVNFVIKTISHSSGVDIEVCTRCASAMAPPTPQWEVRLPSSCWYMAG